MLQTERIKKDFPVLSRKINGRELVYLDSAATSQVPTQVIDKISEFDKNFRANVHRGVHTLSQEAGALFEDSRKIIGDFIGAGSSEEIIFTRGATEGINLVAYSWGEENIRAGDKIVLTISEHHSNFVPWQALAKRKNAQIEIINVSKDGQLELEDLEQKLKGAKLLAITHASNVLGTINPIKMISQIAHGVGVLVLIDGAQAVPHLSVNVQDLGVDFYVFSGHKMLGPTGIGVLWAKKEILEKMRPFNYGGDMIREVKIGASTWNDLPYKFEAGTPNISGAIGLAEAAKYLTNFGMEYLRRHEQNLIKYAISQFIQRGIQIIGPKNSSTKTGVITFNVPGVHPHDVAQILDGEGIAIRTGHHCAMPLHEFLGLEATCRASFYLYNTESDVDKLMEGLNKVKKVFS